MKRTLFAFALIALLLPTMPQARGDVSVDFFYNNLEGGSWIEVGDYGYCWQPDVASDPSWRPYADGYWAYTDEGWTWVSYEDFGWATYHYGRWVRLADYGWVWKPGYEWGPAWVSWRFGGGYVGWAPLPPETEFVYESRPLTGHLDVEFDIGPAYYNFVDVRYIGEPVLRSRIVDVTQNVTYINQTVNVTNVTYKNKTVYNYGPDLNVVNQYSSRPIQKLKLERQTSVDVTAAAKSGGLTKVQGNALVVAAPPKISKPAQPLPPPQVKTKVAQPKIEKGWSVVGDENARQQLKEKIKTQDLKKIPPPTLGGNAAAAARSSIAPSTSASPAIATSPFERGRGKEKGKAEQFQPGPGANAGAGPMTSATPGFPERGKRKERFGEQVRSGVTTSPAGPETSASVVPQYGKPGKAKKSEQFRNPPPVTGEPSAGPEGNFGPRKQKGFERQNLGPSPTVAGSPGENFNQPGGKHNKRFEQQPGVTPSPQQVGPTGPQGGPYGEARGPRKPEGMNQPPPAGTAAAEQPGERKHEGKKKGAESPAPTP